MSKQKLNADERLAAMQERLDRATAKSDLAQQMQVCANNRDALADRLNRLIAVAEWREERLRRFRDQIRQAVANYMQSECCTCCQNVGAGEDNKTTLALLLNVPMYEDRSGWDFSKFKSE